MTEPAAVDKLFDELLHTEDDALRAARASTGPAGMPKPVVEKLHDAVQKAIDSPEVRNQLAAAGGVPLPGPTAQFDKLLKADVARYGKLIREAGIKPD